MVGGSLAMPGVASAKSVQAGYDLFRTTGPTSSEHTIPGALFGPGCDDFTGTIPFVGVPLGTFQGGDVGDIDTVVRRLEDAVLPHPLPSSDTIPIELVALSLTSAAPITVACPSGLDLWDVTVAPSSLHASVGSMTINQTSPQGGTFTSDLCICPLLSFTRVGGAGTFQLDSCDVGGAPATCAPANPEFNPQGSLPMSATNCWSFNPGKEGVRRHGLTTNFHPGSGRGCGGGGGGPPQPPCQPGQHGCCPTGAVPTDHLPPAIVATGAAHTGACP